MKNRTNNEVSLEDVMKYLFDNYTLNPNILDEKIVDSQILQDAVSNISSYDFAPFFDLYVFGTDPLPLCVEDEKLVVLWDQLPAINSLQ